VGNGGEGIDTLYYCAWPPNELRNTKTSKCTYKRNIKARSRNHSCRGKTLIITYSKHVPVDLREAIPLCIIKFV